MSNVIPIVAYLKEGPVVLGHCTPVQAEQLVGQGVFVWDSQGKTLNPRPSVKPAPLAWVPQEPGVYRHPTRSDLGSSWQEEAKEIDPEGVLTTTYERATTVSCATLDDWLRQLAFRKKRGHELIVADNPRSLTLGFVDCVEAVHFTVGLAKVKGAGADVFEKYGVSRDALSSSEARKVLVESPAFPDYANLALLWAQEAEADLEAIRQQEAEVPVLDDLASGFDALGAKLS